MGRKHYSKLGWKQQVEVDGKKALYDRLFSRMPEKILPPPPAGASELEKKLWLMAIRNN